MNQKIELLQVRNMGEIINVSLEFIRENFGKLFKSVAFIALPFFLAGSILLSLAQSQVIRVGLEDNYAGRAEALQNPISGNMVLGGFLFMLGTLGLILSVIEYMRLYNERGYGNFEVNDIWIGVLRSVFPALIVGIMLYVLLLLGTLFFIIPGIYMIVPISIVIPIMINEREGMFSAIERGFFLVRGRWWRTFGTYFVSMIVIYMVIGIVSLPLGLAVWFFLFRDSIQDTDTEGIVSIISVMYSFLFLLSFFIYIFMQVIINMTYYSLREEKDKTRLLSQIDSIGGNSSQTQDTEEQY